MKKGLACFLVVLLALTCLSACTSNNTPTSGGDTQTSSNNTTSTNTNNSTTSTTDTTTTDTGSTAADTETLGWLTPDGLINGLEGDLVVAGAGRQFNVSDPDMGGAYDYFSQYYPNFRTRLYDRENEGNANVQLAELIAAGNTPDVFITSSGDIPNLVRLEYCMALDDQLAANKEYASSLIPSAITLNQNNGKTWGICWELLPRGWMVNIDLFNRMGITVPTADWTVEQFVDVNKKLIDKANGVSGVQGDFHVIVYQFLVAYNVIGSKIVDGKELSAFAEDPNAIKAIELAVDAVYSYDSQFSDAEKNSFGPNWNDYWTKGHVGMVPWSLWGQPYNAETGENYFNWTVLPPPKGPSGKRGGNADSIVMSIFPTTSKADLAFKYVMACTSQHFVDNAYVVNKGSNPPEVSPAGFNANEKKFPVGLPPLNMQYTTHPDNQAALNGFIECANVMEPSPYSIVGVMNNEIVNDVVPGNKSIADMLKEYDNMRNEQLMN